MASPARAGLRRSCAAALALACAAACAGPLEAPGRFLYLLADGGPADGGEPDPGDAGQGGGGDGGCDPVATILAPTCATNVCHGAGAQQGNLDLQSGGMPGRLIGRPSFGGPGLLIDPVHPDASAMYTKINASPPFGSQMPLLGDPLTPAQVACLRDWIHHAVGAP